MLKVAVIGMGHIGNLHAQIYTERQDCELVGVCDRVQQRAAEAGKRHNTRYYLSAAEMLAKEKPDLVSVATGGFEYSSDHYEPTIQALRAGCHVLGEKPISNILKNGEEMVRTAKEMGVCYALDLNHRFTPAAREAKKWQTEGLLGELLFCNMALWIGRPEQLETPFYHLKALNPHSVDIIRYFMGEIEEVQAYAMMASGRNIYSTASINMKFACGAVGHLTSSYDIERGHPMERCEVAGRKGRLVFEDMWREATLYPAGDFVKRVYTNPIFGGFSNFDDTFRDRINHFVDEVIRGVKPEDIDGSAESGLKAQRVIHAAIASIKANGACIRVADVTE
ncbi:MAG: Gfo/Idh/MocA family oxidoreductase [Treponema sp.]|nr:Gfo/Idh/MocA family oxidoreductase [Treponema sp.]